MTTDIETQLKELMLDDYFTNLQNLVNEEVNLMEILRVSHKELQHSNFLAWLFNPLESHRLADFALKEFIRIYFKENKLHNLGLTSGLSVFDFVLMDFDDLEIKREYKNIDLIFLSPKNKFCIVIENKIYSNERKGQLKKYRHQIEREYPEFKYKIYIYLSLYNQQITEDEQDHYIQLNYDHIIKLIEQILVNQRINIADKTRFVFEQYLQTLKSMLNKNEEIEKIALQLYKKYKSAFDLVFKYSMVADGSEVNEISNKIQELINNAKGIKPFKSNKTYRRFQPIYLYESLEQLRNYGLVSKHDDLTENWMFLFEFNIRNNQINFDCKIGAGEQSSREKLYNIYKKNKDVFTKVVRTDESLSPQWHLAFQKQILNQTEIQSYFENKTIDSLIESRFNNLLNEDLLKIVGCIKKEVDVNKSNAM
jgi:hypothetical protein